MSKVASDVPQNENERKAFAMPNAKPVIVLKDNFKENQACKSEIAAVENIGAVAVNLCARDFGKELPKLNRVDAVIVRDKPVTAADLEAIKDSGAKGVVREGIGTDHIDIPAATALGLIVSNTPKYGAVSVADHATAFARNLVRQITLVNNRIKGDVNYFEKLLPQPNVLLSDEWVVGIVGLGNIGIEVARDYFRAKQRLVFDPYCSRERFAEVNAVNVGDDLERLCKESDIITLHAPLLDENRQMFGAKEFSLMKSSAVLINTARGGLINEAELIAALEQGQIAGAALDVFENEPLAADSALRRMDNVLVSAHQAYCSIRSLKNMPEHSAAAAMQIAQGKIPQSVINPQVLADIQHEDFDTWLENADETMKWQLRRAINKGLIKFSLPWC